jgi:hypothetical protein
MNTLSTGLPSLDKDLGGGLQGGGLHYIVGTPGQGKTRGLLRILAKAAKSGIKSILFTESRAHDAALRLLKDNSALELQVRDIKNIHIVGCKLIERELRHLFSFSASPFGAIFCDDFAPGPSWPHPWVGWDNMEESSRNFAIAHNIPVVAAVPLRHQLAPSLDTMPTRRMGHTADNVLAPICDDHDQHGFMVLKGRAWVPTPPRIGVYFS